jgi:phage-related protein
MWHSRSEPPSLKAAVWLGDTLRALRSFPFAVQDEVGHALFLAQRGEKHAAALEYIDGKEVVRCGQR